MPEDRDKIQENFAILINYLRESQTLLDVSEIDRSIETTTAQIADMDYEQISLLIDKEEMFYRNSLMAAANSKIRQSVMFGEKEKRIKKPPKVEMTKEKVLGKLDDLVKDLLNN